MEKHNTFLGEETTIEVMQEQQKGWLFYVTHNTPELFDEYEQYCKDENLDAENEESAKAFMDYRDQLFEEAMVNDL
jgi:hypothetical protein